MTFSNFLYLLGLFWLIFVFSWVIRDRKWKGVLQCAIVLITSGIIVLGGRVGFDGEMIVLVLLGVGFVGWFIARAIFRRRRKEKA